MSAKDTAGAILRDFRTSMADKATYRFRTSNEASAVYDELDEPDWLMTELDCRCITLCICMPGERELAIY